MMELAEQLHFEVEKQGSRFTLRRPPSEDEPLEEQGLTLDEAEGVLNRWKLRGLGGG